MPNAVWPGSLPQNAEIEGYKETAPNEVLRTQMDAGPAKMRRRFTAGFRPMGLVIWCTRTQIATLDTFFLTTLAGGALPFDWTHPRTTSAATFRFTAPPEYTPLGSDAWRARLPVEVLG